MPTAKLPKGQTAATIVQLYGKAAVAQTQDGVNHEVIVSGRLKKGKRAMRSPIAVGDLVGIELMPDGSAVLGEILPRRTVLSRPSAHNPRIQQIVAANVDRVMVTVAAPSIETYLELVDRLLISAASAGLEPVLLINKCDLVPEAEVREQLASYHQLGHLMLYVSAATGHGIDLLRQELTGRTTVFAGPSGAGKSTCLNSVQPGLQLRTGEVKETGGGRHTTTHVSLLRLETGGYVVDTPGVREFGIWSVDRAELALWYPDFVAVQAACRFPSCSHTHEPGCAVKAGVDDGTIDYGRFARYLKIRELWNEPQHWE